MVGGYPLRSEITTPRMTTVSAAQVWNSGRVAHLVILTPPNPNLPEFVSAHKRATPKRLDNSHFAGMTGQRFYHAAAVLSLGMSAPV